MSQVLYRKYRPKKFSEFVGQEYVTKSILGSFVLQKVPHAFLFAGPRGTGKTTVARLVAKLVNCAALAVKPPKKNSTAIEPCDRCEFCKAVNENSCIDVIEIDAASNRGIDEIRNLKDSVRFVPNLGSYKIYIIDEVHMLTKEAFNALLKTLEEPPGHVIFILATTDPHRLPATILSRVQRFDFKQLPVTDIVRKLKFIAKREKLIIEDEAVRMIAISADGGLRDAENNMAKVINFTGTSIKKDDVAAVLDLVPFETMHSFYEHLADKDSAPALRHIQRLYENGVDLNNFTATFLDYMRRMLIVSLHPSNLSSYYSAYYTDDQKKRVSEQSNKLQPKEITHLLKRFIAASEQMKTASFSQLPLELAVIEFCETKSE